MIHKIKSQFRLNNVINGPEFASLRKFRNRYFKSEFWKLCAEKQAEVKAQALRHYEACTTEGITTDPDFFSEVIPDIRDSTRWLEDV